MKRLLVICGPTATGKTSLALHLGKVFDGEIVSADSRQVYKGLDIGTGKDIPKNFHAEGGYSLSIYNFKNKKVPAYEKNNLKIWGYDLVRPDQEFSVKLYRDFAFKIIKDIYKRGKLPIIVGGTGFYIKAVVEPLSLIEVPRNGDLRKKVGNLSAEKIYSLIMGLNPMRALEINDSDRKNRARLIRILEILEFGREPFVETSLKFEDVLKIGLTNTDRKKLYERIDERVEKRAKIGFEQEVLLLKRKDFINKLVMSTPGYRQWIEYLEGKISKSKAIERWKFDEHSYARRQLTWFKKDESIHWFEVDVPGYRESIENLVKKWYKKGYGTKD